MLGIEVVLPQEGGPIVDLGYKGGLKKDNTGPELVQGKMNERTILSICLSKHGLNHGSSCFCSCSVFGNSSHADAKWRGSKSDGASS